MKVTITVQGAAYTVEVSAESTSRGTALTRAIGLLAEVTNDQQLGEVAGRLDQLGQREYGWPVAIETAQ